MTNDHRHVSVCICTFQRPLLLKRLLEGLAVQRTGNRVALSIVVADNDREESARGVVTAFAADSAVPVVYCSEPRQNIALARNATIKHAQGDFVAFIDDDEYPDVDWLASMLEACERYDVAGVLGPVRPHFEEPPPQWVVDGHFSERPEYPTGRLLGWNECRTGNALLRRRIFDAHAAAFDPAFGTGGEDKDFFMRMTLQGHVFRWCNEGVVYESVPRERCTRAYMLRRALLRGRNIIKLPFGRTRLVAQSVIAAPAYLILLPITLFLGQHVFMKYCIKFCDHAGRLLAVLGLNPVRER